MSHGIADLKQSDAHHRFYPRASLLAEHLPVASGPLTKLDRAIFRGRRLFFAGEPLSLQTVVTCGTCGGAYRFVREFDDH